MKWGLQMAIRKAPNTTRRPTGDTAYNARRRYYRKAEAYLKQADSTSGATSARYRQLAKLSLDDAMKTYDKNTTQKISKPIQRIANALGIDLEEQRRKIKALSDEAANKLRRAAIDLGERSKSFKSLRSVFQDPNQIREEEARALLNSPVGQRVIGGTVEIWKEAATVQTDEGAKVDKAKIIPELFKYFKVDNLADLLEKVEDITGDVLYAQGDKDEMYETAKLTLQNRIAADNSVTA